MFFVVVADVVVIAQAVCLLLNMCVSWLSSLSRNAIIVVVVVAVAVPSLWTVILIDHWNVVFSAAAEAVLFVLLLVVVALPQLRLHGGARRLVSKGNRKAALQDVH